MSVINKNLLTSRRRSHSCKSSDRSSVTIPVTVGLEPCTGLWVRARPNTELVSLPGVDIEVEVEAARDSRGGLTGRDCD